MIENLSVILLLKLLRLSMNEDSPEKLELRKLFLVG